ncbi:MAG: hypothetical protein QM753_10355 [Thermomicrobiales bacterium]
MIRIPQHPTSAMHRWVRLLLLGPVIGLLSLVTSILTPTATMAHPLDVYLMGSYVTVTPTQVEVEVDATPGVLLAPDVLSQIDTNGDGILSDAESRAYVQTIVDALQLSVDGTPLTLSITKIEMPSYLNIQAGYGLIRISTNADLPASTTTDGATASLSYVNGFTPTGAMYQVNTFTSTTSNTPIDLGTQHRSDDQASLDVQFAIGGTVASSGTDTTTATSSSTETTSASGWLGTLLAYLEHPDLAPAALAVALGLAMVLGGIHALTPGHGKTLVAAYLVGNKGTVCHAAALGATVTLTHTLSVVAIGLLALFASHLLMPGILVPALQILSGLLVVTLAMRLVRQRWAAFRMNRAGVATSTHRHNGGVSVHHHGDGTLHNHAVPEGPLTARGLVAMGVSGGLVPCPEALGIMILAVGLNHIALGLGLIVAFSLGLAAVLIGLGILLVRSRALLDRVGSRGGTIQRWLPLLSATVVLVLGIGITVKGLGSIEGLEAAGGTTAFRIAAALAVVAASTIGVIWWQRGPRPHQPSRSTSTGSTALVPLAMLPPRYQDGHAINSAPMSAAPLVFDETGQVAWDRIWGHDDADQPFCHLALAGGPPHRGTMLEPNPDAIATARVKDLDAVRAEIERGLRMVTGLPMTRNVEPGWVGLVCPDADAAAWLARAINAENVLARLDETTILLPADPSFRTEAEIKNVVTATAKTYHYWSEHAAARAAPTTTITTTRQSRSFSALRWAWK